MNEPEVRSDDDIILLDGGIGHLLKSRGVEQLAEKLNYDQLFAAGGLANDICPEIVQDVHRDYVNAGANVLTTNAFGCTRWSLKRIGLENEALELAAAGARLARQVAQEAERPVLVAGCLPPLAESYQPATQLDFELMQPQYAELAGAQEPNVDLFLCETMSSVEEALAAITAAGPFGKPVWVSFTLQDNLRAVLRSGETLQKAVGAVVELPGVEAVLVNCCAPQAVAAALPVVQKAVPAGVRIGGYANGFVKTTSEWLAEQGGPGEAEAPVQPVPSEYDSEGIILPEAYAAHAQQWVEGGAAIVGGCCGVGPQHIAALAGLKRSR